MNIFKNLSLVALAAGLSVSLCGNPIRVNSGMSDYDMQTGGDLDQSSYGFLGGPWTAARLTLSGVTFSSNFTLTGFTIVFSGNNFSTTGPCLDQTSSGQRSFTCNLAGPATLNGFPIDVIPTGSGKMQGISEVSSVSLTGLNGPISGVPEPATFGLATLALAGFAVLRRSR